MLALQRARRAAVAYLLAGLIGLCGIGFLIGAAYMWCARRYGGIEAALAFGGGFIVIAILILVAHRLMAGARARRTAERRGADLKAVGIAAAIAALPTLLRGRAGPGALLLPILGLAAYLIYRENTKPGPDEPLQ
jgi:hypothetical protein